MVKVQLRHPGDDRMRSLAMQDERNLPGDNDVVTLETLMIGVSECEERIDLKTGEGVW